MNSARGILLPHLFCQAGQHGFQTRQIDDDSLNSCVIYWDKIACPTNNFVHVALRDEDTLIREGLLLRPKTIITGSIYSGEMVDQTAQWQAEIFRDLDRIQPGFWSFGDTSPENLAQTSEFTDARTALVTLVKSLPLPQNSVPMDNIIEFKSKRLPELHRLRHALDGIYLKIADHRDQKLSLQYEIEELDKACADTIKVSKEW